MQARSEGLKVASVHEMDVVVVDDLMPEMDGHEFAI
jgi:CheY-like chemotaxis protein